MATRKAAENGDVQAAALLVNMALLRDEARRYCS